MKGVYKSLNENESKLIKKIKKGDHEAFKCLYEKHADYALRTAYSITKNRSDASDIVQETFIKIYRNIESFDMKRPFKPWFYQILINESRSYLSKRSKQAINIESDRLLDQLHRNAKHELQYDELELGLDELDDKDRTILTLKYLNGFTEKEIAKMLGANVNTIKSRLYKGRQRLKVAMGGMKDE
ncbi:RNA polymerase sigma-70 factor, ECF subfamily [Virgibacillus subterraneus]|uniref:RNA polymerase sigma-70 factor, ECF subfamily n=1 Tax=Virgibacillus subterraneus TaxID=621109 RepID=A0A1H9C921_9BACI|nr:RNA polymerase sigma-70 factor, ECF subfamily [Virgibacillus subterraneus]